MYVLKVKVGAFDYFLHEIGKCDYKLEGLVDNASRYVTTHAAKVAFDYYVKFVKWDMRISLLHPEA